MDVNNFDVIIIGAGIIGSCIARELSKTKTRICLIDKENDVSCGTSKANSGLIHAGYDPTPNTLMAKYNIRGAELFPSLAKQLNFDYKQIGSLVIACDENGINKINKLYERGITNGVKNLSIINRDKLLSLEPNICNEAKSALYAPTAATISPYQATWAIAESAIINGTVFLRNTTVHSIIKDNNQFLLETSSGQLTSHFVINAAGLFADKISQMVGAREFTIIQRKGEYCLLDKKCSSLVNHILFQTPGPLGKGVLVTKTIDDNILIGPSANDIGYNAQNYTGTTAASQENILLTASKTIPDIPRRDIINSFAGIRAIAYQKDETNTLQPINDFIVEEDKKIKGFINVAGICSPGLSSAPAIAEDIVQIIKKAGFNFQYKNNFIETRQGIPNFKNLTTKEKVTLINKNKLYGQIICRCEMITEGEIVDAIHCPLGARDLDGVKRRTRAGMGRCQSGFCSPRVTEILSRELNTPMINITKRGGTSFILDSKTRVTVADVAVKAKTEEDK